MTAAAEARTTTVQVHRVFIKAPAQKIWDAIVQPGWAEKYGYACRAEYDLRPGGAFKTYANDGMKAHGVPWLIRHLKGEISREDAVAGAVMDTRRYAKRQLTWFRNQMKDWVWAKPNETLSVIRSHFQVWI